MLISIIIPAFQEEKVIGNCLASLMNQSILKIHPGNVEAIVVANGCTDKTVEISRGLITGAEAKGLIIRVISLQEAGKNRALNEGDRQASGRIFLYLDADVTCDCSLLLDILKVLDVDKPLYATGTIRIVRSESYITTAYGRVWRELPYVKLGMPGCGLYAVNALGRSRWKDFPSIQSDDKYVKLHFHSSERQRVASYYHWPLPTGFRNLVKVRRRWCEGNSELKRKYPNLQDTVPRHLPMKKLYLCILLGRPIDLLIFTTVYSLAKVLAVPSRKANEVTWRRGR